ncbi:MAG TPA: DUF6174 domain-containing protein [Anaerolineales bacterium]|nr:DUF6174 domain-containing protein [Anaerolineales bacterium]
MRKIIPLLLIVLGLAAVLAYVLYANREQRYPEATIPLLNDAETAWYNAGIQDYRMVVDVEFATEHRRHTVVVQSGQITEATIAYLTGETWSTPEPVGFDLAADYTIPGLFTALRTELNQQMREELRADMHEAPSYPQYMYFGPVWLDGEPMASSEARFTVVEFELLAP